MSYGAPTQPKVIHNLIDRSREEDCIQFSVLYSRVNRIVSDRKTVRDALKKESDLSPWKANEEAL